MAQGNTRKQHYVWEHYLRAWAFKGTQVWCFRDGKCFQVGTENIAHRRDFYSLKELTTRDIEIVRLIIGRMGSHLQELAKGWLSMFTLLHEVKRRAEAAGKLEPAAAKEIDVAINNMEEKLHAQIESAAVPLLERLRAQDVSFLDDQQSVVDFTSFLSMQYFRTPGMAAGALKQAGDVIPGFNLDAAWGALRTIFATNVSAALSAKRERLRAIFLRPPPGLSFITGDQPILNLRAVNAPEGEVPTELELYYPLSPALAVRLDFEHTERRTDERNLSEAELDEYNGFIVRKSGGQFYANSEAALLRAAAWSRS
jgi:hypothetical protein